MALPLMARDQAVVVPRSMNPPLTVDDSVRGAWVRLHGTGETAVVVTRYGHPFAVASRLAIERAMAAGQAEEPVDRVADFVTVPVDRSADALATIRRFTRRAWDWLVYDRKR